METLKTIMGTLQPLLEFAAMTIGPIFVTYIAAKIASILKVTDEKRRHEIETGLADALHRSARNGLAAAMAKNGIPPGALSNLIAETGDLMMGVSIPGFTSVLPASSEDTAREMVNKVINEAIDGYILTKNPEAVKKLDLNRQDLIDIVRSKVDQV